MLPPTLAAVYTVSFGRWLLKTGNIRGAIGVFIIAAMCFMAPLALLIFRG
ncbi:MAG: hypothetical protein WAP04_08565 [Bacillota bacterium]